MSDYKAWLRDISSLDSDLRIAFIAGEFNYEYTSKLVEDNTAFLKSNGFYNISSYFVPGAFEIPAFTEKLIEKGWVDLVITIGVVIRWATPHFDYVCSETSRAIMDLTVRHKTPIIFGILTCNTEEQVKERMWHGFAISGLNLLTELQKIQ